MRGVPKFNFPAFFAAERALRDQGWEVENPARMDVELDGLDPDDPQPVTMDIQHYLKRDLPAIEQSDAVVLLEGWSRSSGVTKHELPYALKLGKSIYMWDSPSQSISLVPNILLESYRPKDEGLRLDSGKPRVELEDTGNRTESACGALSDRAKGKGRYDLITPLGLKRLAVHYENGAIKYEDRNWEKGFPLSWFLDKMERHAERYKECRILGKEPTEDHIAAVAWNALGFMHMEEMIRRGKLPAELDDLPNPKCTDDRPKEAGNDS